MTVQEWIKNNKEEIQHHYELTENTRFVFLQDWAKYIQNLSCITERLPKKKIEEKLRKLVNFNKKGQNNNE